MKLFILLLAVVSFGAESGIITAKEYKDNLERNVYGPCFKHRAEYEIPMFNRYVEQRAMSLRIQDCVWRFMEWEKSNRARLKAESVLRALIK